MLGVAPQLSRGIGCTFINSAKIQIIVISGACIIPAGRIWLFPLGLLFTGNTALFFRKARGYQPDECIYLFHGNGC
jgi:hypothetical protein